MTRENRDRRQRIVEPLALVALVFLFYAPFLSRPFTSEDFLLIRLLLENPPWSEGLDAWTGPWLGITIVKFYRPLSTFLYALETAAFGTDPWGYNLVHTAVHAGNVLLVWALTRRLERRLGTTERGFVPVATAVLFALYPLHPNAVLFSASFATIFGAFFLLAAFLAYQRFRDAGEAGNTGAGDGRIWWGAALAGFAAALLSYEAAAVFPALLLAYDHLTPDPARRHTARVPGYLPFFGVLGLYFLVRRSIFGVFVGGYEETSEQLQTLGSRWGQWTADVATSIVKLHAPDYGRWPEPDAALSSSLLIVGVPLMFLALGRHWFSSRPLRGWLFAWAWILITQAPFAFRPAVPGNGRYWYLTVIGVALSAAVLTQALGTPLPRRLRFLPAVALMALSLLWGGLLNEMLVIYQSAGNMARQIQGEVIRAGALPGETRGASSPVPRRLFVTRYPYFLENPVPVPFAQVFHYGLRDAVHPPFSRESVDVYPLPPLSGAELLPVALAGPENRVFEWDAPTGKLRPAPVPAAGAGGYREIEVVRPTPGAMLDPARALEVELRGTGSERLRLVVVTPGNAMALDVQPVVSAGAAPGTVRVPLPAEFILSMARLYPGGDCFWWVEGRNEAGGLKAFSRMRGFRVAGR